MASLTSLSLAIEQTNNNSCNIIYHPKNTLSGLLQVKVMAETRDSEHFSELCGALLKRYSREKVRFERSEHVHGESESAA